MAKKSLLMIDPDTHYAGIYANRFESAGWKVWVQSDVVAAKKRLKRCAPDVVMVNLDPDGEALAFLTGVRNEPRTAKALQIVLSKIGGRASLLAARNAGADSYLLKGHFAPSDAVKKVKRLLEEKTTL